MKRMMMISLGAIALLSGAIATAQAQTTISTNRVQVTVGNNGAVQVRTPGGISLNQGLTPVDTLRPSANVTRLVNCAQQSHHQQETRVIPGTGDRMVSQSQSRSVVCQ